MTQAILENLERYHYCSREHVTLAVMWHTMVRCGAVRSLDLEDFDAKEKYIRFRHRPDTDTPLKNKHKSERHIAISEELADLLDEWVENKRLDVTDEYGRRPLITTQHGRISQTTIGIYAYKYTQPCKYAGTCPEGRDLQTCESTEHKNVSTCPASVSPHPFRRGSITYSLRSDVPPRAVSNRADVSEDVNILVLNQASGEEDDVALFVDGCGVDLFDVIAVRMVRMRLRGDRGLLGGRG